MFIVFLGFNPWGLKFNQKALLHTTNISTIEFESRDKILLVAS